MQMFIRLYDPNDMDLIFLKLKYRDKFPGMIRKCLRAHVYDEKYQIRFRGNVDTFAKHISEPICINLNLNKNKDMDVITFLEGIRGYSKSDIIKTIVRSCYEEFPSVLFRPPFIGKEYMENRPEPSKFKAPEPKKSIEKSALYTTETTLKKNENNSFTSTHGSLNTVNDSEVTEKETAAIETKPNFSNDSQIENNAANATPQSLVDTSEKSDTKKKTEEKETLQEDEPIDAFDMLARMIGG